MEAARAETSAQKSLAEILREARDRKRLTQTRLAELTGLSQAVISQYETGDVGNPSLATLQRLARVLDLDLVAIIGAEVMGDAPRSRVVCLTDRERQIEELTQKLQALPPKRLEWYRKVLDLELQHLGRDGRISERRARGRVIPLVTASA